MKVLFEGECPPSVLQEFHHCEIAASWLRHFLYQLNQQSNESVELQGQILLPLQSRKGLDGFDDQIVEEEVGLGSQFYFDLLRILRLPLFT